MSCVTRPPWADTRDERGWRCDLTTEAQRAQSFSPAYLPLCALCASVVKFPAAFALDAALQLAILHTMKRLLSLALTALALPLFATDKDGCVSMLRFMMPWGIFTQEPTVA